MTGHDDDDPCAVFLGEEQPQAEPSMRAIVMTIADEVISNCRLVPYRLSAEFGAERVTISAYDRRLRLCGSATLDYAHLAPCEDDEIAREVGRCIGRAISRALEREVVADAVQP